MRTLALALVLVGCGHEQTARPQQQASPAVESALAASEPTPVAAGEFADIDRAEHMRAMQGLATGLRDAVLVGDLPVAKLLAEDMQAGFAAQTFDNGLHAYYARLNEALGEVTIAGSLDQAGLALANVALACGNCHDYARGGPRGDRIYADLPTQGDESMSERMQRHDVAMEQLWLGLSAPSDEMWLAGGKTLASAPLAIPVHDDRPGMELMAQEVEAMRAVTADIRLASSPVERAEIYGRLMGRCGVCHRQTVR